MPFLYGVTFHPDAVPSLPRALQRGIPGNLGWGAETWKDWHIHVRGSFVFISQPVDLTDENVQGFPAAAREELDANARDEKRPRLVYSVPRGLCVLHYVEDGGKVTSEKSPSPALVVLLEERRKAPPAPSRPPGVPAAYQGPAVTPMRAVGPAPPASPRPVEPPPSVIVMDGEDGSEAMTP